MRRLVAVLLALACGLSLPCPALAADEERRVEHEHEHEHEHGTAIVVANVALDFGGRRFSYTDGLSSNVRDYEVYGVPMPAIGAEVYPCGGTTIPVLRDVGLTFDYRFAFGLESATTDGRAVDTTWDTAFGGLRFRVRPWASNGPMFGISAGAGVLRFHYEAPAALAPEVPDVSYAFLRVGLDGRIPFWRMAALVSAGYDGALSAGKVYDRFRDSTVGGIDLGTGLAMTLGKGFEVRVTAHYTRYFYAFAPEVGDVYVAGGALDQMLRVGLGVAYAY